jgi:restriction system protein
MMAGQGANRGVIVTAGTFTTDARDFANGRNLELLNGEKLKSVLRSRTTPVAGAQLHGAQH